MITAGCMTNCLSGIVITDDSLKAYTVIFSVYVNRLVQYVQSQSNNRTLEFFLSQYPFIESLVWFVAELRFTSNSFTLFHAGQVCLYFWNGFKSQPRHWPESLQKMQRQADLDLDSI